MHLRPLAPLLGALALGLGAVGCGDDDDGGGAATTPGGAATEQVAADGKQVFNDNCANCHTLSAAGADGQVGPNLDESDMDAAAVADQVRKGGSGMPPFEGVLDDGQIQTVADYVVEVRGQ